MRKIKQLRQYNVFDAEAFFKDKDVRVISSEPWSEYQDGKITKELGTKYQCIIATDNTKYKGDNVAPDLNAGYQVDVKVEKPAKDFKKFSKITFVNSTATVYGTFMHELSVQAEDVIISEK